MAFLNLAPEKLGLVGSIATNLFIQGKYATDFPFTRKDYLVNFPQYWNVKNINDDMDWQNHPETQKFHFLRNHLAGPDHKGSILEGQKKKLSCDERGHHSIDEIVRDGLWLKDSKGIRRVKTEWPDEPVIEDSKGIATCLKNFSLKLTDNDTCIKHTPRLARTATAKYLLVLINYMKYSNEIVQRKDHLRTYLIDHFFEGSLNLKGLDETMSRGVMRCDNLPE